MDKSFDVQTVDEYMAAEKWLEQVVPPWTDSVHPGEIQAIWNIEEEHGRVRSQLRFRMCVASRRWPSISLIFQNNPVWRIDITPDDVCEENPIWAQGLGSGLID